MQVNGETHPHREGLTLHRLLTELNISRDKVAIAVNDDFFAGGTAPDITLNEHDTVEIVRMIGGG